MNDLTKKLACLKTIIQEMDSVLIAYSGGVDSTFLLKIANDVLGDQALGVTARSETYPEWEYELSQKTAKKYGFRHISVFSSELNIANFSDNPETRCYYCKNELFSKLRQLANEFDIHWILDGSNASDLSDYRPGSQSAKEHGVRSPLQEVGLTKDEIRVLSKDIGLPTWDKPSFACLASRFPYGEKITAQKLEKISAAEKYLLNLGFTQVRVRYHKDIIRIEILPVEFEKIVADPVRTNLLNKLKSLGFKYITLDLQGYRTGSMNEVRNI